MLNQFDLENLDDAQRKAVEFPMQPLLVLAGPGTGKTRTLVCRVLHLINHFHVKPEQVLAVTYTNKATEEMRERLRTALGDAAKELTVGTFHGFCIRILRAYHSEANLPKHFTVADEEMQIEVLSRVVKNIAPDARARTLRSIMQRLSETRLNDSSVKPLSNLEKQFFRDYQKELRKNCLIDFDDILMITRQLFIDHPEVLQIYRDRFTAILVDEFQDTDRIQYEIIKMLASVHRNVFAVADDDQSIFAWRGAHPENVHNFRGDFAGDNVIQLDQNYRSTEEIVAHAGNLIVNNNRLAIKKFAATAGHGIPVRFVRFDNETDEADFLMNEILSAKKADPDLKFSHFAALFARHSVGENLEQEFMKVGIPCQLVRGKSILENDEIARALLLLRLIYNPDDQLTLERFVKLEVDDLSFAQLKEIQSQQTVSFKSALAQFIKLESIAEQSRAKVVQIIGNIKNMIDLKRAASDRRLSSLLSEIMGCISGSRLSALTAIAEDIKDPLEINGIARAARLVADAISAGNPVLVIGNNEPLRFVIAVLLSQVFPCASVSDLTAEQLNEQSNAATEGENKTAKLCIVLDPMSFDCLNPNDDLCTMIYVGTTLPQSLLAVDWRLENNIAVLNPYDVPGKERGLEPSITALVFKLCQAVTCLKMASFFPDYTAIDIETTDLDVKTNEIVEIAAVRVRGGIPVAEYQQLIKPKGPISTGAQAVHGLTAEILAGSPDFSESISAFCEFIGDDVLVAHNGDGFDFPCIKNRLRDSGQSIFANRSFDTLPFARRLFPGRGASIDALAEHFRLDTGTRHRALDDTKCLVHIFEHLKREHDARLRATALESHIDTVAFGILIEQGNLYNREALFLQVGAPRISVHGSTVVARFREKFPETDITEMETAISNLIESQGTTGLLSPEAYNARARFDEIVARFDNRPLEDAIVAFLDFVSLYQTQDGIEHRDAVTLMTIYAAKGLEFARVFVVALEQGQIPSFYALKSGNPSDIEEQRRLLYVAITRAKEQLILTGAAHRDSFPQEHSQFLRELQLDYDFDAEIEAKAKQQSPDL